MMNLIEAVRMAAEARERGERQHQRMIRRARREIAKMAGLVVSVPLIQRRDK